MSIGNRITEAFSKFIANDYDNAIIQSFIMIDGTAKRVYEINDNKKRFTKLIDDNLDLISTVMFLKDGIPKEEFLNNETFSSLLYQMRCSILHEGFLENIKWNERRLTYENGNYLIPNSLITALILLVVSQKENSEETIERGMRMEFYYKEKGIMVRPIDFLGEKDKLVSRFNHLKS